MGKGRSYSRMIGFGGPDQMTVETHTSWGERMGNSCCGSVFGLVLLVAVPGPAADPAPPRPQRARARGRQCAAAARCHTTPGGLRAQLDERR